MKTSELHQQIELLRAILVVEQQRDISYSEAEDLAGSLIQFYEVLAESVVSNE